MTDDDLDIYGDLVEFQEVEERKSKELIAWEERYNEALKDNDTLRLENKDLLKKIKTIEVNFQNLLDTAKAELERQKKTIANLRKEKDDICFRRKRPKLDENHENDVGQQQFICEEKSIGTNKFVSLPDTPVVPVEERPKSACAISENNKCINITKTVTNDSKGRQEKDMQRSQEYEHRPRHRRHDDVVSHNRHDKSYDRKHEDIKRRRGNSSDRRDRHSKDDRHSNDDRHSKDDRRDVRYKTQQHREQEDNHNRGDRHSKDERRIASSKTKQRREREDSRDSAERHTKDERKVSRSKTDQHGRHERPYLERDHKSVGERSNGDNDDTKHKEQYNKNVKESKSVELCATNLSKCSKDLHDIEKIVPALNEPILDENTNLEQGTVVTEIKPSKEIVSTVANQFEIAHSQDATTIKKPIRSETKIHAESVVEITSTEDSHITGETVTQSHINQQYHSELPDKLISSTSNTDVNSNTITINSVGSDPATELSLSTPKKVALFNELFGNTTNSCSEKVIPNSDLLKSVINLLQNDSDKPSQMYSKDETKSNDNVTTSSCLEESMDSKGERVINIDVESKDTDLHKLENNVIPGLDLVNTTESLVSKLESRRVCESQADVFMDLEEDSGVISIDDDDQRQAKEVKCTMSVEERNVVSNKDNIDEVDLNRTLISPLNNELKTESDLSKKSFELRCNGQVATETELKTNNNLEKEKIKPKSDNRKCDESMNINGRVTTSAKHLNSLKSSENIIDKEISTEIEISQRAEVDNTISKKEDINTKNCFDTAEIQPILEATKKDDETKGESAPSKKIIAEEEITTDGDNTIKEELDREKIPIKCGVTTQGEVVLIEEVASDIKVDPRKEISTKEDITAQVVAREEIVTNKDATSEQVVTRNETIEADITAPKVPKSSETDSILIGTEEVVTIQDAKRKTNFPQDVHVDSTIDVSVLSTTMLDKSPAEEETIKKKELLIRSELLTPDISGDKLSKSTSFPKSEEIDNICHVEASDDAMTSTQYKSLESIVDGNSQDVSLISQTEFNETKSKTFMSSTLLSKEDDKGAIESGLLNVIDNVKESSDKVQLEQTQAIDAAVMLLEMANNSQNSQGKAHIEIIEDLRLPQKFTLNELSANSQIKLTADKESVATDNRNDVQIIPSVETENAVKTIVEPMTSSISSESSKSISFIDDKVKSMEDLNDLESIPEISSDAIELALRALHDSIPLSPKKRYTRQAQQQSCLTTTNQDQDDLLDILSGSADTTPTVDTVEDGVSFVCKLSKYKSNLSNLKIDEEDSKLLNSSIEEPNVFEKNLIESNQDLIRLKQPSKSVSEIVVELQSVEVPKQEDVKQMHKKEASMSSELNLDISFETNSNWKKFKIPKIKRTQDNATEINGLNGVQSADGSEANPICFEELNKKINGVEKIDIDTEISTHNDIQDELEIFDASGEKITQPKRGRGRPRKHPVMPENLPVKEKGKPGRKKRQQVEDEQKNVSGESAYSEGNDIPNSLPMVADKKITELGREQDLNNLVAESKEFKSVVSEKDSQSMFSEQEKQDLHNLETEPAQSPTCRNQHVFELNNDDQSKSLNRPTSPVYIPETKRVRLSSISSGETVVNVNQDQEPPLEDSSIAVNVNANITTDVTIDETIAPVIEDSVCSTTQLSNDSNVSTNNGSIVTKRVSLGSTDYRFEQMPNNQIKLVVTRRGRKRKAAELSKTTEPVAVTPSVAASPTLPVINITDAMP